MTPGGAPPPPHATADRRRRGRGRHRQRGPPSVELEEPTVTPLWRTRLCSFWVKGACWNGERCAFAHGEEDLRPSPDFERTSVCPVMLGRGSCNRIGCRYAHSSEELRLTPGLLKTKMCSFFLGGMCVVGEACRFAHSAEELREATGVQRQLQGAQPGVVENVRRSSTDWQQRRRAFRELGGPNLEAVASQPRTSLPVSSSTQASAQALDAPGAAELRALGAALVQIADLVGAPPGAGGAKLRAGGAPVEDSLRAWQQRWVESAEAMGTSARALQAADSASGLPAAAVVAAAAAAAAGAAAAEAAPPAPAPPASPEAPPAGPAGSVGEEAPTGAAQAAASTGAAAAGAAAAKGREAEEPRSRAHSSPELRAARRPAAASEAAGLPEVEELAELSPAGPSGSEPPQVVVSEARGGIVRLSAQDATDDIDDLGLDGFVVAETVPVQPVKLPRASSAPRRVNKPSGPRSHGASKGSAPLRIVDIEDEPPPCLAKPRSASSSEGASLVPVRRRQRGRRESPTKALGGCSLSEAGPTTPGAVAATDNSSLPSPGVARQGCAICPRADGSRPQGSAPCEACTFGIVVYEKNTFLTVFDEVDEEDEWAGIGSARRSKSL